MQQCLTLEAVDGDGLSPWSGVSDYELKAGPGVRWSPVASSRAGSRCEAN